MKTPGKGRILIILLLGILLGMTASSANSGLLVDSYSEEKTNENIRKQVTWKVPKRKWIPLNGSWELKAPVKKHKLADINVPCRLPEGRHFLLEKQFILEKQPESAYRLHLGMVRGNIKVILNDSLVYTGNNCYIPISLSLTSACFQNGINRLQIDLESHDRYLDDIPAFLPINLPRIDTGLLDGIFLEIQPAFHIQEIQAASRIGDSTVHLDGKVILNRFLPDSSQYKLRLRYYVQDRLGQAADSAKMIFEEIFQVEDQGFYDAPFSEKPISALQKDSLKNDLKFWVDAALEDSAGTVMDRMRQFVAMRENTIRGNQFLVNQAPVFIKGINYVYQDTRGSELIDPELIRKDLADIKARGFNAVRIVFRPLPEQFYQYCQEVGLLCFQDLPFVYSKSNRKKELEILRRWYEHFLYLNEMARRYPAVAAIGIAFYINSSEAIHLEEIKKFAEQLPSCPVPLYSATLMPGSEIAKIVDIQIVDIIERNHLDLAYQKVEEQLFGQHFIPSGYSKAISYRTDSTAIITQHLLQIEKWQKQVGLHKAEQRFQGHFIPTYNDYYSWLPALQNGVEGDFFENRVGLVDIQRVARNFGSEKKNTPFPIVPELEVISEAAATHSYIYILVGMFNFFIFLISYKRFRGFRQDIHYSIKKSHGFFVDLQERIIIPTKQSMFLLLVIAINAAVIYSSLAFFHRNDLFFDYLLSVLFAVPETKTKVLRFIWDQPRFLAMGTLGITVIFFLMAITVKLFSLIGDSRVFFRQALAVSIWAAAPVIFLLPLGMFVYNALLALKSYWIIISALLYFHVWVYYRWINGIRVLTDRLYSRVFIWFTLAGIVLIAGIGYIVQQNCDIWEHLQFVYKLYNFQKLS